MVYSIQSLSILLVQYIIDNEIYKNLKDIKTLTSQLANNQIILISVDDVIGYC